MYLLKIFFGTKSFRFFFWYMFFFNKVLGSVYVLPFVGPPVILCIFLYTQVMQVWNLAMVIAGYRIANATDRYVKGFDKVMGLMEVRKHFCYFSEDKIFSIVTHISPPRTFVEAFADQSLDSRVCLKRPFIIFVLVKNFWLKLQNLLTRSFFVKSRFLESVQSCTQHVKRSDWST